MRPSVLPDGPETSCPIRGHRRIWAAPGGRALEASKPPCPRGPETPLSHQEDDQAAPTAISLQQRPVQEGASLQGWAPPMLPEARVAGGPSWKIWPRRCSDSSNWGHQNRQQAHAEQAWPQAPSSQPSLLSPRDGGGGWGDGGGGGALGKPLLPLGSTSRGQESH